MQMPFDLRLDDVALFVRIVEGGSLSAAARERNIPVSQVTRSLARVEAACGARLLHRTTHSLSLTDEGDAFLAHARRLLHTVSDLQGELGARAGGPRGWVRLGVSAVLAQAIVAPCLPSLYERHPGLHIDLAVDDRQVDMARDGIDVALRTGDMPNENLVARPLGQFSRSLYAAPSYLARYGTPKTPQEVFDRHRLLANTATPALSRWPVANVGNAASDVPHREVLINAHTRTDNTAVVLALAVNGVGIARVVDRVAEPLVRSGALVPVLPEHFRSRSSTMFAVMLPERHRLPKVRAVIDHLAQWISGG